MTRKEQRNFIIISIALLAACIWVAWKFATSELAEDYGFVLKEDVSGWKEVVFWTAIVGIAFWLQQLGSFGVYKIKSWIKK
jgi:hypothetical protein